MARFIFNMQNILNIKLKLEEQAKAEFAIANKIYFDEVDKLEKLKKRKLMYEMHLRELYSGLLKLQQINETKSAIDSMEEFIKVQEKEVKKAEKNLNLAREKLNKSMQERKTYEKLRERAFEEFLEEIKQEEDKVTDEIVSFKYGQKANTVDTED